jgi:uncharacterized cupredoxin-like copper-binding protein
MHVRRRWLLVAALVLSSAAMTLALACSSSSNKSTDSTPTESANGTATAMAGETPSGTSTHSETPGGTEAPGTVHISETDSPAFTITGLAGGAIASPAAGDITFEIHNDGTVEHSFYVFKTDTDQAALALSGTKVDETKAGTNAGEIESIPKGTIKTLPVTLAAGKYVIFCNVAGHYQQGMHAAFEVM